MVFTSRIIPARAGFTLGKDVQHRTSPDHPRSRGVYPIVATVEARDDGSSPLARGLQRKAEQGRASTGIIPARAGFTGPAVSRGAVPGDHPRSRGVYAVQVSDRVGDIGSSPLARGLPAQPKGTNHELRIIPARAGFTYYKPRSWDCVQDHPRSRGVYGVAR